MGNIGNLNNMGKLAFCVLGFISSLSIYILIDDIHSLRGISGILAMVIFWTFVGSIVYLRRVFTELKNKKP